MPERATQKGLGLEIVREIIVVLVPMILSLTVHEYAHAWSAFKLGDDTAASQGRLTLSPLAHIDIFGTLIIPAFAAISPLGIALIGWAKPVPVSPYRFHRGVTMRRGMIITALAGPGSNLLLAIVFGGLAMALYGDIIDSPLFQGDRVAALRLLGSSRGIAQNQALLTTIGVTGLDPVLMLLGRLVILNVGLMIFNMFPLYPLDGSRLLPQEVQEKMARYVMFVFFGFLVLINVAGELLWYPTKFVCNVVLGFWSIFF